MAYRLRRSSHTGRRPSGSDVLIADDSVIVSVRLAELVRQQWPGARVLGPAIDGDSALRFFREGRPRVVILDLHLPGMGVLHLLPVLREEDPECAVLVLSRLPAAPLRRRCLDLGATGFFDKAAELDALAETVRRIRDRRVQSEPVPRSNS